MANFMICNVFSAFFAFTAWQVHAEVLHDPTRPPASLLSEAGDGVPQEKPKPVLQSVALGTTHKSALINGQTVMLGQQFEGLTLVKLSSTEATFKAKHGQLQVLRMEYPVQKNALGMAHIPVSEIKTKRDAAWQIAKENK